LFLYPSSPLAITVTSSDFGEISVRECRASMGAVPRRYGQTVRVDERMLWILAPSRTPREELIRMSDSPNATEPDFDTGPWATIATWMKVMTKRGRLVISDGHLGLLRENGDLIDSAPVSTVVIKKGFTYSMSSIPTVIVNGAKYKVMLSYERSLESGLGDEQAKEIQAADNERLFAVIRSLGGKA